MNPTPLTCFHCTAAIPTGIVVEERRGEELVRFCCRGCQGAYLLISGTGLEAFYQRRQWQDPGISTGTFRNSFPDGYLERFVYSAEIGSAIDVIIDGIRCASCVWLNERIIGSLPGVLQARVNYATGRARITFDPAQVTPADIFTRISRIGYRPRPYTRSEAQLCVDREKKDLLIRLGTAFFLTMQLMPYAFGLYAGYFQGIGAAMRSHLQFFSLVVTTPVIFYSGWPFLRGAWLSIANRSPNMELLIAIGALSSYGYSVYASFTGGEVYYETAAMIVTLILAGRLLENAAKRRAAGGVERLLGLSAGEARRLVGETLETVDVSELKEGETILVGPGERFPVDGRIIEGTTDVDESPATGEALPVARGAGDRIIAGSTNLTGAIRVICDKCAAESFIARVARLVEEAQSRRAPIQRAADRAAAFFVPAVLLLSLATFCWQIAAGKGGGPSLMAALAVLVIACPCALGLATPTAIVAGTGAAAGFGVIFKGGDILERLSRVTLAAFDKTGTLTCGRPAVIEARPATGTSHGEFLALAAAVEGGSHHPVGKAICDFAAATGLSFPIGERLCAIPGAGVTGQVGTRMVAVGSPGFLAQLGVLGVPTGAAPSTPAGVTQVLVAIDRQFAGSILLRDTLRQDAASLVSYFTGRGIKSLLLSGDTSEAARETAKVVGIAKGIGRLSPAKKSTAIRALSDQGEIILMVGDGINDAPALSSADVGCAVAGGTDIAIETSDLVLVKPDLERLARAHHLAQRTMSVVRQNLVWAFIYNIVGIPLAMTGRLTPIYAAAAMALSSLCVVGNSLRIAGDKRG